MVDSGPVAVQSAQPRNEQVISKGGINVGKLGGMKGGTKQSAIPQTPKKAAPVRKTVSPKRAGPAPRKKFVSPRTATRHAPKIVASRNAAEASAALARANAVDPGGFGVSKLTGK